MSWHFVQIFNFLCFRRYVSTSACDTWFRAWTKHLSKLPTRVRQADDRFTPEQRNQWNSFLPTGSMLQNVRCIPIGLEHVKLHLCPHLVACNIHMCSCRIFNPCASTSRSASFGKMTRERPNLPWLRAGKTSQQVEQWKIPVHTKTYNDFLPCYRHRAYVS